MTNSGKWVILIMVGMGIVLAGLGIAYRYNQSRQLSLSWGTAAVRNIHYAEHVTVFRLGSSPGATVTLECAGLDYPVAEEKLIDEARGLSHARDALGKDISFVWPAEPPQQIQWGYALRFTGEEGETTLSIASNGQWVARDGQGEPLNSQPIAAGLVNFLAEQFPPAVPASSAKAEKGRSDSSGANGNESL